jgi:hypothetical protein
VLPGLGCGQSGSGGWRLVESRWSSVSWERGERGVEGRRRRRILEFVVLCTAFGRLLGVYRPIHETNE